MIKASSFVPGRVYSVVYVSDVDMVGKRDGIENPLAGSLVTVRRVSTVQAAGNKTWTNYLAKSGRSPVGAKTWWTPTVDNTCIVEGTTENTKGKTYLRGLPRGVTSETYFVNGVEATPTQVEHVRMFKKNSGGEFVLLNLDKLENVDAGTGEKE